MIGYHTILQNRAMATYNGSDLESSYEVQEAYVSIAVGREMAAPFLAFPQELYLVNHAANTRRTASGRDARTSSAVRLKLICSDYLLYWSIFASNHRGPEQQT